MSALAAPHDTTTIDGLLPSPRRDAVILRVALIGAVALHALALLLPTPARQPTPPAERDFSDPPDITIYTPPPPPSTPPPREPTRTPQEPGAQAVPVIIETPPPALIPTVEQETIVDDLPTTVPVVVSAFTGEVAPPPRPSVYDQATIGLVLPVPLGDRPQPVYPAIARTARRGGRVVLQATISVEGLVEQVDVLSAPNPDLGFVEAAREAVLAWRYEPGRLQGRPVGVMMTVVVSFAID